MNACDECLRRGLALELLAGHLETERARIGELLAYPDEALVDAVAGQHASELRRALTGFDPEAQRARIAAAGLQVVCRCSDGYPAGLLALRAPPAALYVTGSPRQLASLAAEPAGSAGSVGSAGSAGSPAETAGSPAETAGLADPGEPAVAIVGARRASSYGVETARSLASALAGAGVTVVSGLALGIDSAAHAGALQAAGDDPARRVTIAVLPGGADRPYPASHRRLYTQIQAAGLIVSELPPGVRPRRWMFPARNRIIAALSTITVVVQARSRSGALVTARHAAQLGRRVGAVPGQVNSPLSSGPHALIQGGAELITGAQDVLDLLYGPGERAVADLRRAQLDPTDAALLDALDEGYEGNPAFVRAGLGPVQGLEAIAGLELAGLIRRAPGGRLTVIAPRPRS